MITREHYEALKAMVKKQLRKMYPEDFDVDGFSDNTALSMLGSAMLERLVQEANDEDFVYIE